MYQHILFMWAGCPWAVFHATAKVEQTVWGYNWCHAGLVSHREGNVLIICQLWLEVTWLPVSHLCYVTESIVSQTAPTTQTLKFSSWASPCLPARLRYLTAKLRHSSIRLNSNHGEQPAAAWKQDAESWQTNAHSTIRSTAFQLN